MLESEKQEINSWLRSKYPEVFAQGALENLQKKIEEKDKNFKKSAEQIAEKIRERERPVVVETDLIQHLTNRIDHYLFKKFPEIFVEDNLKYLRKEILEATDNLQGKENRINARYTEWEASMKRDVELVKTRLIADMRQLRNTLVEITSSVSLVKPKWWEFWKKQIVLNMIHRNSEDE